MKKKLVLLLAGVLLFFSSTGQSVVAADRLKKGIVVFTIDDGRKSTLTAVNILQKYGYTATLGIITSRIGKSGNLTINDLKNLSKKGCKIECHTVNHKYFTGMTDAEILASIEKANNKIVTWGFPRPTVLIPPGGDYGEGEGNVEGYRLQNLLIGTSISICRQAYPQIYPFKKPNDIESAINRVKTFNQMKIKVFSLRKETVGTDWLKIPDDFYNVIYHAIEEGVLVILVIHEVTNNTSLEYNIPPRMLEDMADYISRQSSVEVLTLEDAVAKMLAAKKIGTVDEINVEDVLKDPTIPISDSEVEVTDNGTSNSKISISESKTAEAVSGSSEAISESDETISDSETTKDEDEGGISPPENVVVASSDGGGSGGCFISTQACFISSMNN